MTAKTVIAVEDDKVLRFLQILLDPATPLARMNVFADYVAHDVDQQQWLAEARAQVPAVFPASVRLLANDADLRAALPESDALVVESMQIGAAELALADRKSTRLNSSH